MRNDSVLEDMKRLPDVDENEETTEETSSGMSCANRTM